MRFYVFILIVVRISTSFFIPISFPRYASQSPSRTVLWVDGNDGSNNDSLQSLDHFVSVVESLNEKLAGENLKIVSRGANDIEQNEKTGTKVFYDPTRMEIFIVISRENSNVLTSKIRDFRSNNHIVSVPADTVESLCGFPIETLPPLGYQPSTDVSCCTTIFDENLLKHCRANNLSIISGAGHPYWKMLLSEKSVDVLNELSHVQIADVIQTKDCEGDKDDEDVYTGVGDGRVWEVSTTSKSDEGSTTSINLPTTNTKFESKHPEQFSQKPYFPIDGPSMSIARLVIRQKELSNPLSPVFLTAVGRVGNVSVRTKRSLRCTFLPPSQNIKRHIHQQHMNEQDDPFPWNACSRDGSITVDLVFGKIFLQALGAKQGAKCIETIQESQLLQIEAKTNPGQRESIEKWVDEKCLELIVMDCQLLSPSTAGIGEDNDGAAGVKSDKQKKNAGTSASLPTLSLDKIFDKYASIKFVDDLDSITEFSEDVFKILSRSQNNGDSAPTSSMIGIDCEWQPREFMDNPSLPQPVLLLQISLHELQKVYLLDLQALLRPLMPPDASMNEMEAQLSNALSPLMESKFIIKVGYQLSSDLRRIFASYSHIPCFREVQSTLEISSFIKRVLHVSKQKKSRYITTSLASMTSHYLEMTVDKENQMTDWALRDLTPEQLEYAAIDAAVTPKLMETVLQSIAAHISMDHLLQEKNDSKRTAEPTLCGPVIRRWDGDDAFVKEVVSCRFHLLPETSNEATINEFKAKQIVGPSWIATSTWTAIEEPPAPLVLA